MKIFKEIMWETLFSLLGILLVLMLALLIFGRNTVEDKKVPKQVSQVQK